MDEKGVYLSHGVTHGLLNNPVCLETRHINLVTWHVEFIIAIFACYVGNKIPNWVFCTFKD